MILGQDWIQSVFGRIITLAGDGEGFGSKVALWSNLTPPSLHSPIMFTHYSQAGRSGPPAVKSKGYNHHRRLPVAVVHGSRFDCRLLAQWARR